MKSLLLTILAVLLMASPVFAWNDDYLDLTVFGRELLDSDCTDDNDTPAGLVPVYHATPATAFAGVFNPDANRDVATQTTGSADGLCDAKPWVLSGAITTGSDEEMYLGPIKAPKGGFLIMQECSTIVTDYRWNVEVPVPWGTNETTIIGAGTADTTTNPTKSNYLSPHGDNNGQIANTGWGAHVAGLDHYLLLDLDGTGAWVCDSMTWPMAPVSPR